MGNVLRVLRPWKVLRLLPPWKRGPTVQRLAEVGETEVVVDNALFALYKPLGDEEAHGDVVLFHGLQPMGDYRRAWWHTWVSETNGVCWPSEWLGKRALPGWRVLSVSYDSAARRGSRGGNVSMDTIADMLAGVLVSAGVGARPLVLVGHSLGGIVMKQLCNRVAVRAQSAPLGGNTYSRLLDSVLCLVFYSTPHNGAHLADKQLVKALGTGPVVPYLRTLHEDTGRINADFRALRTKHGWPTLGFGETLPTHLGGGLSAVVVQRASAQNDMDEFQDVPEADHVRVCKPAEETSVAYLALEQLVLRLCEEQQVPVQLAQIT